MKDEEVSAEFARRREERLKKSWETYPNRNPIASDLSDCRRYMVLRQVAWELRPAPGLEGLQVIEQGRHAEPIMIRQMQDEGWEIVQQQASFELTVEREGRRVMICRGKIDGRIVVPGTRELLPFDTKDTSDYTLESYDTEHDLYKNEWSRKWLRQAIAYLLGFNLERFLFVLGHRGTRKLVFVHLWEHAELAEKIMSDCEWTVQTFEKMQANGTATVEKADGELGPYHPDYSLCRTCWLRNLACFPPEPARSKIASVQPTLEPIVERYLELKPLASEYEKVRKDIKQKTEGAPVTVAGHYIVDGQVESRSYKAQPAKPAWRSEYWSFDVRKVGER